MFLLFLASFYLILCHCATYPENNVPVVGVQDNVTTTSNLLVQISFGPIIGRCTDQYTVEHHNPWNWTLTDDSAVRNQTCPRQFLGIPFAEPPLGELRFQHPRPWTRPWSDFWIRNTNQSTTNNSADAAWDGRQYRAPCWQFPRIAVSSENCLFLNIFTPPAERIERSLKTSGRLLPVMFWIYGGAFLAGDGDFWGMYDASFIVSNKDVLVVTFNYRLGIFGFYQNVNSTSTPGNYGYMDQRMALQWVKEHISAFGGDPDQITVFGLSSGATSVATLITDTNAPIFHKAIILSNPFSLIPKSEKTNRQIGTLMAVRVGCLSENQINSTYNGDEVSYCMRQKTPKDLLMASTLSTGIGTESLDGHPMGDLLQYGPTVDNDNVMGRSLDLIINPKPELESRLRNIRLIIGTTRDEMTFSLTPGSGFGLWKNSYFYFFRGQNMSTWEYFKSSVNDHWKDITKSWDEVSKTFGDHDARVYENLIVQLFGRGERTTAVEEILKQYPASFDSSKNFDTLVRLSTDYIFTCPTRKFALAISNYAQNVFMYRFSKKSDWLAPILGEENSLIRMNAVPHAIDIPYIFHLPGRKPLVPAIDRDREDDLISRWIVDYYTSFAHNATEEGMQDHRFPIAVSPVSVPPLLNVTWRKFEEKFQYYVDIDDRIELKQNLRAEECKLWDRLMPDYLVKSMSSRQTGKDERAAYQF